MMISVFLKSTVRPCARYQDTVKIQLVREQGIKHPVICKLTQDNNHSATEMFTTFNLPNRQARAGMVLNSLKLREPEEQGGMLPTKALLNESSNSRRQCKLSSAGKMAANKATLTQITSAHLVYLAVGQECTGVELAT
jgi:hypothetical protein